MKNKFFLPALLGLMSVVGPVAAAPISSSLTPTVIVNTTNEPITEGKFQPTWESLKQYQCPEWFRDAKFGIWSVWGPEAVPKQGDWYARNMYMDGSGQNKFQLAHYGSPAQVGYKDIINMWHAEKWDPARLMELYKQAGAKYFMVLLNHHDNYDLWDSKYQEWNSVATGPKRNILGEWAAAAKADGLRLGVSIHAAHAWTWFEPAQKYDGKLTKADGKGQWWDGLDPQELYAQNHALSKLPDVGKMWDWDNGANLPDQAYCDKFYNRCADVIKRYQPDVVYFDDDVLPLWPASDAGLKIAADFYNSNMQQHGGKLEAVLNGKDLDEGQRQTMVWDIERGQTQGIEPLPWQTDTCVGSWYYKTGVHYKTATYLIRALADIVSKNGNLMLNAPLAPDGTLDADVEKTLATMGEWLGTNGEAIYGTRPWKTFGEGPTAEKPVAFAHSMGFNENVKYSAADIRFTAKGDVVYAIDLGWPTNGVSLKSFGKSAKLLDKEISKIELLGSDEKNQWTQNDDALVISQPKNKPSGIAVVFKITFK